MKTCQHARARGRERGTQYQVRVNHGRRNAIQYTCIARTNLGGVPLQGNLRVSLQLVERELKVIAGSGTGVGWRSAGLPGFVQTTSTPSSMGVLLLNTLPSLFTTNPLQSSI